MPHPFGNIGPVILGCLGEVNAIDVRSHAAVTYVDGYARQGVATNTPTTAVVQPSTPKEKEQLPEGERTKEAITVYTLQPLSAGDVDTQAQADVILWKGREWVVMLSEDWTDQANYARAIATRKGV